MTPPQVEQLIDQLVDADADRAARAGNTLASMGRHAAPRLREAIGQASAEPTRRRLTTVAEQAEAIARGDEGAVPVVAGRWRFLRAYPQATMPDGRFVFHCDRALDVREEREVADCLVFFDPATDAFEVRPIDRAQWAKTNFYDKRRNEAPVKSTGGSVVDLEGGLWVPGGYRFGKDGQIRQLTPPGLDLELPHALDADGRVYFAAQTPNKRTLYVFRPDAPGAEAAAAAPAPAAPGQATTRPSAAGGPGEPEGGEFVLDNVRELFRQPDVAPPWNAWAVRERPGEADELLRLDGPAPRRLDPPRELEHVGAVVPLNGGCVASGRQAAGFWDGEQWHVEPSVRALVARHGPRLVAMVPPRAFAADTSAGRHGPVEHHLMLAADGRGGLWIAEDVPPEPGSDLGNDHAGRGPRVRRLWHWDGRRFTDLLTLLPMPLRLDGDGAVMTAAGGRAFVVQLQPTDVRPGGYWAIWRTTDEDLRAADRVPQGAHRAGLSAKLLAALDFQLMFSGGLWSDRQGWIWSPIFSRAGDTWTRRFDAKLGFTSVSSMVWPGSFEQAPDGPVWYVTGKAGESQAFVWADVSPPGDAPKNYGRTRWVGTSVPGMSAAARLAVGPGAGMYLLHEGGCSLLRLRKLEAGEQPKLPVHTIRPAPGMRPVEQTAATRTTTAPATGPATAPATRPATELVVARFATTRQDSEIGDWEIEELARRPWSSPRNEFGRVAFDATGVWVLSSNGALIRTPLPGK